MDETTATGRARRKVPEWAKEGRHVTVVSGKVSYKGIVVEELSSAVRVAHRMDRSHPLGTYSLASVDDQPEGTLAQSGHNGMHRSYLNDRIESVDGADGDAPVSPRVMEVLDRLLPLIPNHRMAAILTDLLSALAHHETSEDSFGEVDRYLDTMVVEREIRRLSAT